ncbi:hypothetical protein [Chryseobacterium limigenitum]|uniref:Uncharacterized protein n=1 Tax=Chryseobacterium limigenitum TaxID=1612149 RepID=A0A1K2IF46_9FLAO|nr:hypothetical protein [Chryseobacterium limigenitum]SFZ91041.1 hypothetical protein SAMN05216324_10217 [Chryseobacterium limigenitum]
MNLFNVPKVEYNERGIETTITLYDEIDYKYNQDQIFEFNVTLNIFLTAANEYHITIFFMRLNTEEISILEKLSSVPLLNISSPYFTNNGLSHIKKIAVAQKFDLQWECIANPLDPINNVKL